MYFEFLEKEETAAAPVLGFSGDDSPRQPDAVALPSSLDFYYLIEFFASPSDLGGRDKVRAETTGHGPDTSRADNDNVAMAVIVDILGSQRNL